MLAQSPWKCKRGAARITPSRETSCYRACAVVVALMTPFAEWLQRELDVRRINRSQLAAYMGRPSQTVSSWFNDDRIPRPDLCRDIAQALGMPLHEVLVAAGHWRTADGITFAHAEGTAALPAWLTEVLAPLDEHEMKVVRATAQGLLLLREEREAAGAPDMPEEPISPAPAPRPHRPGPRR